MEVSAIQARNEDQKCWNKLPRELKQHVLTLLLEDLMPPWTVTPYETAKQERIKDPVSRAEAAAETIQRWDRDMIATVAKLTRVSKSFNQEALAFPMSTAGTLAVAKSKIAARLLRIKMREAVGPSTATWGPNLNVTSLRKCRKIMKEAQDIIKQGRNGEPSAWLHRGMGWDDVYRQQSCTRKSQRIQKMQPLPEAGQGALQAQTMPKETERRGAPEVSGNDVPSLSRTRKRKLLSS